MDRTALSQRENSIRSAATFPSRLTKFATPARHSVDTASICKSGASDQALLSVHFIRAAEIDYWDAEE